jgi:hypothetical protein
MALHHCSAVNAFFCPRFFQISQGMHFALQRSAQVGYPLLLALVAMRQGTPVQRNWKPRSVPLILHVHNRERQRQESLFQLGSISSKRVVHPYRFFDATF